MPKIDVSTKVKGPPSIVYKILKDIEKFPQFMHDAKRVEIIKKISKDTVVTKWQVDIDGTPLDWEEEDLFNDKEKSIKFKLVEGNFKKYEGEWLLEPVGIKTRITLRIYLEWGVPNFEKYVGSILEAKALRSIKSMIWLVRKRANKWTNSVL